MQDNKSSLQRTLKESTSQLHAQIERTPLLNKIIQGNISKCELLKLLNLFYAYIQPCEEIIKQSPMHYLLDGREKAILLKKDILNLQTSNYLDAMPKISPTLPELNSEPQILAYMYVIEGSTLGGQIITKSLHKTLKITPANGASFFSCYGSHTGRMWQMFCEILNNSSERYDRNEIISSVHLVYTTLCAWMLLDH